ncbi:MAG: hypothetical protein K5891_03080 [Lachnospiraceae bacterium]|nr:hypothetical protein [Lachnospiraceae bacterium]
MGNVKISQEIIDAINDPGSIKVLASISRTGELHVVPKGTITVNEEGNIRYYELLEGSQTNKNVTFALWFGRKIAINIITPDRRSYQIKGIPVKSLVAGKEYQKHYERAMELIPDSDLAAVYEIELTDVREESYPVRFAEEARDNPLYIHLDKLAGQA